MEKWPFWTKTMCSPPWKKVSFFDFWTSCFYSLERLFFVLKRSKRHFPSLYLLKKKLEKLPFLDQNHGLTPLEKCEFFDFWIPSFYSLERRFSVLEYCKRHFPCLNSLKKKNVGNMAIFWDQNHGFTPLKKCEFFNFLNFLFL